MTTSAWNDPEVQAAVREATADDTPPPPPPGPASASSSRIDDPWGPSSHYEQMNNRRLALEAAAKVAGSAVTYTRDGAPDIATTVLAAARQFAAYLDGDEAQG